MQTKTRKRAKRYNWLSKEEKHKIYFMYISGDWYIKEICDMFNITQKTLEKVVNELRKEK